MDHRCYENIVAHLLIGYRFLIEFVVVIPLALLFGLSPSTAALRVLPLLACSLKIGRLILLISALFL